MKTDNSLVLWGRGQDEEAAFGAITQHTIPHHLCQAVCERMVECNLLACAERCMLMGGSEAVGTHIQQTSANLDIWIVEKEHDLALSGLPLVLPSFHHLQFNALSTP